jgi:hypothetical protein
MRFRAWASFIRFRSPGLKYTECFLISLMMASCWTLLLKRRRALSRDSPSSTTINANKFHLLYWPMGMAFIPKEAAKVKDGSGVCSRAREFPPSPSRREKAPLSPFRRSLRSLPPLLELRSATKGLSPLEPPLLCSRKSANSLSPRLALLFEEPCPLASG